MRGRHAKPSPTGKAAGHAARLTPALAVAGAMLGMAHHQPSPPKIIPVELDSSAGLDGSGTSTASSTKPATHVYVVRPGDTLWSVAQRYYGSGLKWTRIYNANQSKIRDPNEIYVGQKLTIPEATASEQAPATETTTAIPDTHQSQLTGVPAMAAGYIEQAAKAIGLPASVVEAQNYIESSYGQNMGPSVAGAMGPWQFEPGTWALYSTAPFSDATNWDVSTPVYIAMMKQLLHWSGGNIQTALAAYNAGQGNWQAGLGYANTILAIAG